MPKEKGPPKGKGSSSCYGFLSKDAKWKVIEPWVFNTSNIHGLNGNVLFDHFNASIEKWEDAADGVVDDGNSINILGAGGTGSGFATDGSMDGVNGVVFGDLKRFDFNEIIDYCNEAAYGGQLKPLRGKAPDNLLFPPMYCINVKGNSIVSNTSRYNLNEVKAIVTWLLKNKKAIEAKYGKLEKAVGIITPFTRQKNSLINALKKAGIDTNILKLGTVHALQGAERPIILFSAVYGKGDSDTMFFDRDNKPNMLNVAVSRAKDNFIIFANTEILDKQAKTPSGILAKHLTYQK